MNLNELLQEYFTAFSNKDINTLITLFADDIVLIDWNTTAYKKEDVLSVFVEIFKTFKNIKVEINDILINSSKASVQLCLVLDDLKLKVVDIIYFKDSKICKIDAYKQ